MYYISLKNYWIMKYEAEGWIKWRAKFFEHVFGPVVKQNSNIIEGKVIKIVGYYIIYFTTGK